MIKKILNFFLTLDLRFARLLSSWACELDEDTFLRSATVTMKKRGYIPFQVKEVAGTEYIRCQNTNAWRKVGR